MPDEFVAIDLETTGLDRSSDRITEVGATRFNLAGEAESFQSLVDPGIPIPTMIEDLTGITNADVRGAPTITGVAAELAAFCGSRPVIGQNVAFDTGFLRAPSSALRRGDDAGRLSAAADAARAAAARDATRHARLR